LEDQILTMLRDQVSAIMLGTVMVFAGLSVCAVAAIRGRVGVRVLIWFGILTAMYGFRVLARVPAVFAALRLSGASSDVVAILDLSMLIPGLLFCIELSVGNLRRFFRFALIAALLIGVGGVCSTILTGSPGRFDGASNILVISVFLVLTVFTCVPTLAKRSWIRRNRITAIGALVLALAIVYSNLGGFFHLPYYRSFEPLAFMLYMFSLGYVAVEGIFANNRRLLAIESELAVAREIQSSILPSGVPEMGSLRISAAYCPMTAVAGDFYEFVPVDQNRFGLLVADVSGHGVPAALVAAMIKVAMQSVVYYASEPREVLRGLSRILSGQLRGQLISAAYLWLDTESGKALYSAAGHPPLLRWRKGTLERIESNGLLMGVMRDADYPVCEVPFEPGDRFLLYTDGVVEPENAAGQAFGDHKLEQVIRENQSRSPAELSDQLLLEIRRWQPASVTQQDDITLIILDIAQRLNGDAGHIEARQGEAEVAGRAISDSISATRSDRGSN
jgi:sigma-B regulation protein RsbU (phosphoserine phosphatase)